MWRSRRLPLRQNVAKIHLVFFISDWYTTVKIRTCQICCAPYVVSLRVLFWSHCFSLRIQRHYAVLSKVTTLRRWHTYLQFFDHTRHSSLPKPAKELSPTHLPLEEKFPITYIETMSLLLIFIISAIFPVFAGMSHFSLLKPFQQLL